jgi:hypothetical protein
MGNKLSSLPAMGRKKSSKQTDADHSIADHSIHNVDAVAQRISDATDLIIRDEKRILDATNLIIREEKLISDAVDLVAREEQAIAAANKMIERDECMLEANTRENEAIVHAINMVAVTPNLIVNDTKLLHACGHHIANIIEVNRSTTSEIMNHIEEQRKIFDKLGSLSEDNIKFILSEIVKVMSSK